MSVVKISAKEVAQLRAKTGAGMMDCKKALVEAEGDFQKAIENLRKKGQKVAANRGDREASEGVIIGNVNADNTAGAIIALNCETDFVAKNSDFIAVAQRILDVAMANNPADLDALKALEYGEGMTIADKVIEQTGVIGEKIEVNNYSPLSGEGVVIYNHPGYRLSTGVVINKNNEAAIEAGKEVAMQIASNNPVALDKSGIAPEVLAKEQEIGKDLAIKEGKPAEMAEKISIGRVNKFIKENTLLSQTYFSDSKKSVQDYLTSVEAGLTVTSFVRANLD
tara:strand:- start:331820 stop:332659 length:840 start_codon:yes stop_codon:yes gene_type:complete